MFLIMPFPMVFAYHVPTQAPSNLTLTVDYENGTVKADWDASDQAEDYPAERYAIGFGLSDDGSMPYGIATGNVGDSNALNTEYTFTANYLNAVFNEAHGLFHVKIRSDNDTNASYSDWTPTVSVTIQNKPSAVSIATYDMNRSDGIKFEWSASTSGFVTASTYKLYYKLSSANDWTLQGQQYNTDYVLPWSNLTADPYDFMVSACGSENDCNDSNTLTIDVVTYVAPTTTSTTTTTSSTTTTTTTTTTVPPKPEPKPEPYVEPEPLPPPPEEIIVDIVVEGVDKTYTQADVNDGTIERDQERIDNEAAYGCFMTDAQIDRGDCIIIKEEVIDEKIIIEDKKNVEIVIPENVVEIFDAPEEKEVEIEILEFEEQPIEFEVIEFDLEDVAPKDVVEIPIQDEIIEDIVEDELDETLSIDDEIREDEIQVENNDDKIIQEIVEFEEEIKLIEVEEAIKEIVKVEEIIELKNEEELNTLSEEEVVIYEEEVKAAIVEYVEDLDQEDQIEVIKEVTNIGITNLDKATKKTKQVVQAVVNEVTKVENVKTLTQEQTEVVADILGFEETEDVAIIAEAAAKEENIAQAVDEYVERASNNANVENYNLSDVVVEIAVENFIADPISIIQIDFDEITINNISSGMTSSQKEKAQEVVVPVILARIATIGSFIMRKSF
jgi:hypothetical protein